MPRHGNSQSRTRRRAPSKPAPPADQKRISQLEVIAEDVSGITNCRKCNGILKWGEGSRLDDLVSCVYCGWRPSAKTVSP